MSKNILIEAEDYLESLGDNEFNYEISFIKGENWALNNLIELNRLFKILGKDYPITITYIGE